MTHADARQRDRFAPQTYQERSQLQDCSEIPIISNSNSSFFVNHSLCTNCSDYYEVPPCLTSDLSCFPSSIGTDPN